MVSTYSRAATIVAAILSFAATGPVATQTVDGTVEALVDEGRRALMVDPVRALTLAYEAERKASALPPSTRKPAQLSRADWLLGAALVSNNRAPEAGPVLAKALGRAGALNGEFKLLGDLHSTMAFVNGLLGQTEKALYELQVAFRYFRHSGDVRSESLVLQNIGTMYFIARDYDSALKYYSQAHAVYSGDVSTLASLLINQGKAYKEQDKLADSERAFSRAATLALSIKSTMLESSALTNLAATQVAAGNIIEADKTIDNSLRIIQHDPSAYNRLPSIYAVQAEVALRRGRIDSATNLIERAFSTIGSDGSKVLLREFERTAYEIYKARGDRSRALAHLERFKQLDDQARALAASTNAALISARFDFANQNARIAQLRQNEAEQRATIQRNQIVFQRRLLGAASLILVLLLLGFFSTRRSRNQVRAANDELTDANRELERALAARTEFLAMTSHEIRTPLNGILGMTQVLLAERGLDTGVKGKIELVQSAGETMKALVDDILDVAKLTNGELTIHRAEMDLQRLLRDAGQVWQAHASGKQVAIEVDTAAAPARIVEDEVRLRQIVFNLMANAVKFTDRGTVRLEAGFVADAADDGQCGTLRIAIRDTGIGIPANRLEEIFESFRQVDAGITRRHGGTGLGLAICRNLARTMGGDVTVASVLGGGSTFTLELPCEAVVRAPRRERSGTLDNATLLLIEANPLARSVQTAVLGPHVGKLLPSGDIEEARRLIEEEAVEIVLADAGAFGLDMNIVADFAASGAEQGVSTVLLWPTPDAATIAAADAAGVLRVVAKPIPAQELVAALKDIYMKDRSPEEIAA